MATPRCGWSGRNREYPSLWTPNPGRAYKDTSSLGEAQASPESRVASWRGPVRPLESQFPGPSGGLPPGLGRLPEPQGRSPHLQTRAPQCQRGGPHPAGPAPGHQQSPPSVQQLFPQPEQCLPEPPGPPPHSPCRPPFRREPSTPHPARRQRSPRNGRADSPRLPKDRQPCVAAAGGS